MKKKVELFFMSVLSLYSIVYGGEIPCEQGLQYNTEPSFEEYLVERIAGEQLDRSPGVDLPPVILPVKPPQLFENTPFLKWGDIEVASRPVLKWQVYRLLDMNLLTGTVANLVDTPIFIPVLKSPKVPISIEMVLESINELAAADHDLIYYLFFDHKPGFRYRLPTRLEFEQWFPKEYVERGVDIENPAYGDHWSALVAMGGFKFEYWKTNISLVSVGDELSSFTIVYKLLDGGGAQTARVRSDPYNFNPPVPFRLVREKIPLDI